MEEEKKNKLRKAWNIAEWVLIGALLAFDVFIIAMRFGSSSNGATNFFGNQVYIVQTGSMEGSDAFYAEHPEYEIRSCPVDSAVFVNVAPSPIAEGDNAETAARKQEAIDSYYGTVKVGDILTFRYTVGTEVLVTHRIISIRSFAGTYGTVYEYTLRGDNPSGDKVVTPYSPTQKVNSTTGAIVGKVGKVDVGLGKFVVNFVQNKVLIGVLIIAPAAIMFLYEVGKIVLIVYKDKHGDTSKDGELEALRQELAEIKENSSAPQEGGKLAAMREYRQMLDEGLITEEEFQRKKEELLK